MMKKLKNFLKSPSNIFFLALFVNSTILSLKFLDNKSLFSLFLSFYSFIGLLWLEILKLKRKIEKERKSIARLITKIEEVLERI